MTELLENLSQLHREQIAQYLFRLRGELANGAFLRQSIYTVDESRLAGNTHHYWVRLGLDPNPAKVFQDDLPDALPDHLGQWLNGKLDRKIIQRLPREYSTLIKIPFSVPLSEISDERDKQIKSAIAHGLPSTIPYAIFHLEINRLLRNLGMDRRPPTEIEFETLLARYSKTAIAKARTRFPEVWDELRGHYVLDSRGTRFAKSLVTELQERNLLHSTSKFVDVGSGVGTNVFAVNHYSDALAVGIERHTGLHQIARVVMRRLQRLGRLDSKRTNLVQGDAFDRATNLEQYDILYVYSPIGMWEIDIDMVVDRAKIGAVMIFNRLPIRNRGHIEPLANVAGLYAFRKVTQAANDH